MPEHFVLAGAAILHDGDWLEGHAVAVRDGVIQGVLPEVPGGALMLPPRTLLAPGLIDVQVNGGGGILFNDDPSFPAACAIAAAHRRLGTTSILPTLITDTPEVFCAALAAARTGAGVLGIHFEGPFLSPRRPGVHDAARIRPPRESDVAALEALARRLRGPVLLTLDPEVCEDAVLRRLRDAGVVLAAGHTAASFERMNAALAAGVSGFTHLYNAMPPLAAREPGPVAAALLDPQAWCGVIADGIHVHPAMLRLLFAAHGVARCFLVSDAMPPAGTTAEGFSLQGRRIFRRNGRLENAEGTLAGADLSLAEAVRRAMRDLGLSAAQALAMASTVPADFLGLPERGRIAAGNVADMVLLTEELDVLGTWRAGQWQGEKL